MFPGTTIPLDHRRPRALAHAFLRVLLVACIGILVPRAGRADDAVVPTELQAELIAKLSAYDRNFTARAGDTVRVLVVVKPGDARSKLSAASMQLALSRLERIGGLPHQERIMLYDSSEGLAKLCRAVHAAVVYVTPGLDDGIDDIRTSLRGVDVLSVAAVADYVPKGIVLGFELVSGKPRISFNLEQAKQQNVNFKADALSLMKVYR